MKGAVGFCASFCVWRFGFCSCLDWDFGMIPIFGRFPLSEEFIDDFHNPQFPVRFLTQNANTWGVAVGSHFSIESSDEVTGIMKKP